MTPTKDSPTNTQTRPKWEEEFEKRKKELILKRTNMTEDQRIEHALRVCKICALDFETARGLQKHNNIKHG